MRLRVNLESGTKLRFEPDLEREKEIADHKQNWDEYDDHRHNHFKFCRKHYGRGAVLVDLVTETVKLLDPKQRLPGVYHTSQICFRFIGEKKLRIGYNRDFVVIGDVERVQSPEPVRIADLPEDIEFYPDDIVMVTWGEGEEEAKETTYEKVEYGHLHNQCSVTLIKRGNIYWLYHDPNKMSFASPVDELRFWWGEQNIINSKYELFAEKSSGLWTSQPGKGIATYKPQFERGEIDFVVYRKVRKRSSSVPPWTGWKLRDTFAAARPRVRAIGEQFYLEVTPAGYDHDYACVAW